MNEVIDKISIKMYKNYGLYVNRSKMIPSNIDGLIPVQRRILLTLHSVGKTFIKTAKLLGDCMAMYHPHSEAYGTAIWAVSNGFADGDGQWGSKIGITTTDAAAFRYTKIKSNTKVDEMVFKLINDVPWVESEVEDEPEVLPTLIPLCLIGNYELTSIAFGYKTEIPVYNIKDITKRLLYLLGDKKEKEVIIKNDIYRCDIVKSKENKDELKSLLEKGYCKLDIIGKHTIDDKNKCIYINGWNPRNKFTSVLKKIDKYKNWNLLSNLDIGYIDLSSKENGTSVKFEVLRQRNVEQVYEKMKEAIVESLKSKISYNIYTVHEDSSINITSVDQYLLNSFNYYKKYLKVHFENEIKRLEVLKSDYKVIELIRPHISSVCNKNKIEENVKKLSELCGCGEIEISEVISKYRIKSIFTINTDISNINDKIKEMNLNIKNIDDYMIKEVEKYV